MNSRPRKFHKTAAYHEAGHAVAAVALGLEVKAVSIIPDKARGTIEWYSGGRTVLDSPDYGNRGIIVLLAGKAAQKRNAPSSLRRHTASGDYDKAKSLIFGITPADIKSTPLLLLDRWNRLLQETEEVIETNWTAVNAVANRLLETGELTGAELKIIFRQHGGRRSLRKSHV